MRMPRRPPSVRARGLGAEMRAHRAETGLSTRAVAQRLGWAYSTLNRIEGGKRKTTPEEIAALLVVYDVKGAERERLLALTREIDQPGWWETGPPGVDQQLPAFISFESTAARIVDVCTLLMPGLLQTAEYTREVMLSNLIPAERVEMLVSMRLGRQAVLSRGEPPEYTAIIDEAALRRPLGGGRVMAEQIRSVVKASQRSNAEVRVVPLARGNHPGIDGPYVLMEFAKARTIVHLEHKRSSLFLDEPDDVSPFVDATATLQRIALDPDASREFLAAVAAEYEQLE